MTKFETKFIDIRIEFDSIVALLLNEKKMNVFHFDEQNILTNDEYNNENFDIYNDEIILNKFHDNDERFNVIRF